MGRSGGYLCQALCDFRYVSIQPIICCTMLDRTTLANTFSPSTAAIGTTTYPLSFGTECTYSTTRELKSVLR
jgi:hypothetical protein